LAMAPETNIGSSTPIDSAGGDIKGALGRKIRNDAVASLKALLVHHGRNPAFARQAVIEATNLTADDAQKQHVIDRIAPTLPALLVIDLHVVSHGALTVAGLICLAVGSIMLFHNAPAPYHTSKPLVIGIAVGLGALWAFAVGKAWQVRGRPVSVGPQTIAGALGEVRRDGLVFVNGELWQAKTPDGERLTPGERVRVESLEGLVLTVRPEGVGSSA